MKLKYAISKLVKCYDEVKVKKALRVDKWLGYSIFGLRLGDLASETCDEIEKCLWLELSEACCVHLQEVNGKSEYKFIHEKLPSIDKDRIALYRTLLKHIKCAELRARIADLVWEFGGKIKDKHQYALDAVSAYRESPLDLNGWYAGRRECWYRAARLTRKLGTIGKQELTGIAEQVRARIFAEPSIGLQATSDLVKFSMDCKLPGVVNNDLRIRFGSQLKARDGANYLIYAHAQDRFAELCERLGDKEASVKMQVEKAVEFMRVGAEALAKGGDKRLAGARYEDAERVLVKIPKQYHIKFDVAAKLKECKLKSREGYEWWNNNLQRFQTDPIDVSGVVKSAKAYVKGFSVESALPRFVSMHKMDAAALEVNIKKILDECCMHIIASRTILSEDGRSDITIPSYDPNHPDSPGSRLRFDAELIHLGYAQELNFAVKCVLFPAYEIMAKEHNLKFGYFGGLCQQSKFVPQNRVMSCAKGLFYGWRGDFVVATKLLIPEIENVVRIRLAEDGVETRYRDVKTSSETENGLSSLVCNRTLDIERIFGDDLGKELKWLFGRPPYLNLRNHYAHGLENDLPEGAFPLLAFYVWWFFLKQSVLGCFENANENTEVN